MSESINEYKADFRNLPKYGLYQILCNHFITGMCKGVKYQIQITKMSLSNNKTNLESMNPAWTSNRKTNDTEWIERLHTFFSYGLNDKIGQEYNLFITAIISLDIHNFQCYIDISEV